MRERTRFLIRTWSNWLARGGGGLTGLAIAFSLYQQALSWHWVAVGAVGILMAAAGVVLIRYIPYGPSD